MTIGRRLLNLARSELNSLLDKAAEHGADDADPDGDLYQRYGLDQLTDAQLEAEIERRRKAREKAARAAREAGPKPQPGPSAKAGPSRPNPRPAAGPAPAGDAVRRAYAALEVPAGSSFEVVRKSYRTMMRKYHPDRHTQSPEKQKAANELAQKLTDAYKTLDKHLRR